MTENPRKATSGAAAEPADLFSLTNENFRPLIGAEHIEFDLAEAANLRRPLN